MWNFMAYLGRQHIGNTTVKSKSESQREVSPAMSGNHSSISDIDTVTTVSYDMYIVNESFFE